MSQKRESKSAGRRRRLIRLALLPLKLAFRVALRVLVSGVVFLLCTATTMRLLGYALPGASDVENYFESIKRLADVLS